MHWHSAGILSWNLFIRINRNPVIRRFSSQSFIHHNRLIFYSQHFIPDFTQRIQIFSFKHCFIMPKIRQWIVCFSTYQISLCINGKMIFVNFYLVLILMENSSRFIQKYHAVLLQFHSLCQNDIGKCHILGYTTYLILHRGYLIGNHISEFIFFSVCFFCHFQTWTVHPDHFRIRLFSGIVCLHTGMIQNLTPIHLLRRNTAIGNNKRIDPLWIQSISCCTGKMIHRNHETCCFILIFPQFKIVSKIPDFCLSVMIFIQLIGGIRCSCHRLIPCRLKAFQYHGIFS